MSRINILYLTNFGEIVGGGEVSLVELILKLDKERFLPLVVCPQEGKLKEVLNNFGIEVRIIKMESLKKLNLFGFLFSIVKLIRVIKEKKISLVHANGSRCAIYGGFACKLTKVPLIWHVRILEPEPFLDRFLFWLSKIVIVNSYAVKERFKWSSQKDKIRVIYNGIDLSRFKPLDKAIEFKLKLGIKRDTPVITTIGRLDWYKAHQYFLEAAKKVKEVIPEVCFLIVGKGEREGYLKKMAKNLGIEKETIFVGFYDDIPSILAITDVFVLSSISEGFGRVVLEAMAVGKPVVATKIGGIKELVLDQITGILVPPKDSLALAEAIIRLLKNSQEAKRLGEAGLKRAEFFNLEKSVELTQSLYKEIIFYEDRH